MVFWHAFMHIDFVLLIRSLVYDYTKGIYIYINIRWPIPLVIGPVEVSRKFQFNFSDAQ